MHISYGETVKGMILNALGFVNAQQLPPKDEKNRGIKYFSGG
jgi:hypothetical protein